MKLDQWLNPTCVFSLFVISGLEAGLGMRLGGPGLPRGPGLPILGGKVLKKWARTPLFHTTINSSENHPYAAEILRELETAPFVEAKTVLQQLLREKRYPKMSKKYEELHATKWLPLFETSH